MYAGKGEIMETYNYVNDGFGCDCAKKKSENYTGINECHNPDIGKNPWEYTGDKKQDIDFGLGKKLYSYNESKNEGVTKREDTMKNENVMKNEMKIVKRGRMRDLYLNGVEIQGVRSYILEEDVDSIPVIKLEILLSDITIMDEEDYYFGDEFYWDNDNDLDDYDDDDNDINSNNEGE